MMSRGAVLLVLALGACVSKGQFELVEVQLDATRAAVSARAAQQAEDVRALEARVGTLEEQLILRQAQLDMLELRESLNLQALDALRAELAVARAALADPTLAVTTVAAGAEPVAAQLLQKRLQSGQAAFEGVTDRAVVEVHGTYLVVRIPLALLVQEGWTTLSPRGELLVTDVAKALQTLPGVPVRVEGHTDSVPKHSAAYPSNWSRGFGQAITVVRALEVEAVPVRLSVASLSATQPLADIAPDSPQQQRVELWIDLDPAAQQAFEATSLDAEG